jgi:exopolyphosphatase / guanosine-5'-triphosphate,3'-diphosphate pyrophosphatase
VGLVIREFGWFGRKRTRARYIPRPQFILHPQFIRVHDFIPHPRFIPRPKSGDSHNKLMARVYASADIGSNTAHLLVAATDGDIVMRIDNLNEWIALGEVVSREGEIPKDYAERLVGSLKEFQQVAVAKGAEKLYVFATEAMRMAKNHRDVLARIKSETGIAVDLIQPEREAELSFIGVRLDTREIEPNLLFEVGGGSAQVAKVSGAEISEDISLPLGTGRLIAQCGLQNPCPGRVLAKARDYIASTLDRGGLVRHKNPVGIASGGVARGLWRALHPDGEKRLAREELAYLIWSTERLNVERIIERFNVKAKRAGTLLPGALVYEALMDKFGLAEISISEFGVREGAILEMARGKVRGQKP